ncbi:M3 family metallopeptidase [Sphingomonas sp. MMS24-JH45]
MTLRDLALENAYALPPTAPGVHPQTSFGHLAGYSAFYYTYIWSKTIATDLWTRFASEGLRTGWWRRPS